MASTSSAPAQASRPRAFFFLEGVRACAWVSVGIFKSAKAKAKAHLLVPDEVTYIDSMEPLNLQGRAVWRIFFDAQAVDGIDAMVAS